MSTRPAVRLRIARDNVKVALGEFEAVWTRAEALFQKTPTSRYLGGFCAACRWAAGHPEATTPLYRQPLAATAELILREDLLATMTYRRVAGGDSGIDADWAAGVAMTLGWIRGVLQDSPLRAMNDHSTTCSIAAVSAASRCRWARHARSM
jgi:hypothetical protein